MEYCDCTETCKSKQHGDHINAILTKRALTDVQIYTYLSRICHNCETVRDSLGRTALHVAASVGRRDVVRWLIRRKANLNSRDSESSYTPLHRSIYYGNVQVTVELLQAGATGNIFDNDGLTFSDHAVKNVYEKSKEIGRGEAYVWGPDVNDVFGARQSRSAPELWEAFHKEFPEDMVEKVYLNKFHCVVIGRSGRAFSCGHGQGGRLGLGNERTALKPTRIQFTDKLISGSVSCVSASISRDHSVFLTESEGKRYVWSCGSNAHNVLGITPPPANQVTPRRLNALKNSCVKGVATGRYHSVAWNEHSVFAWGLHAGQLGHDASSEKYVVTPKVVSKVRVKSYLFEVAACSGATVVLTKMGEILVFHQYKCVVIPSRGLLVKISAIGGKLNTSLDSCLSEEKNCQELKIAALTMNGKILIWYESDPSLIQCVLSLNREIIAIDLIITLNGIAFVTREGETLTATVKQRKKELSPVLTKQTAFNPFLDRDKCHFLKVTKLPYLYRCLSITSDPVGMNFAVIQADPKSNFEYPETIPSTFNDDFLQLLNETDSADFIHDLEFHVGLKTFAVHKYILVNCSKSFLEFKEKSYKLEKINPELFEEFLTWIYTEDCRLIHVGKCPDRLRIDGEKNPVRLLQELAKKFCVTTLEKILSKLTMNGDNIEFTKSEVKDTICAPIRKFDRLEFPELYDIDIVAKNGQILSAHRCVLIARVELFKTIYSLRWNMQSGLKKIDLPFTYGVLELFLEYIYTDDICLGNIDTDTLYRLLELSDQYLIERLKNICQIELCARLSLKNAIEILTISNHYNAKDLKRFTMHLISRNLPVFLDSKVLHDLSDDLLQDLTNYYQTIIKAMQNRIITPYSSAETDENVLLVIENCPITTEAPTKHIKTTPKSHRTRHRSHKDSITESSPIKEESSDFLMKSELPDHNEPIVIPSRIKAIAMAHEKVLEEKNETCFVNLNDEKNFTGLDEFPSLGSSPPAGIPRRRSGGEKKSFRKQLQENRIAMDRIVKDNSLKKSENPWKISVDSMVVQCDLGNVPKVTNMETILLEEKQLKENYNKMLSKSLALTQIEDKALEDLEKFYNCSDTFDEAITTERVGKTEMGSRHPTWAAKKTQKA